jgi:hypothetical protein
MTDFSTLSDELAAQRIADRIADRQALLARSRATGPRRGLTRHAVARQLHRLADHLAE